MCRNNWLAPAATLSAFEAHARNRRTWRVNMQQFKIMVDVIVTPKAQLSSGLVSKQCMGRGIIFDWLTI
jgi:hypothetical protein